MCRIRFAKHAILFYRRNLGIGKEHKLYVFGLSEIPLFGAGFGVDRNYLRACLLKIVVSLAQTEELPGADPSMECPKENQDCFLFAQQTAERGHFAIAIR